MIVLVEGPGDVRAVPILLQRALGSTSVRCVDMGGKSNIVRKKGGFEDTVNRSVWEEPFFLILLDGDRTFPPYRTLDEEQEGMTERSDSLAARLGVTVRVCWAVRELESWLGGGIHRHAAYCGLNKANPDFSDTEVEPPDPKQWIESKLKDAEYGPSTAECLARNVELAHARARNGSLRTFLQAAAYRE
jgi:hypothetical protein